MAQQGGQRLSEGLAMIEETADCVAQLDSLPISEQKEIFIRWMMLNPDLFGEAMTEFVERCAEADVK